MLSKVKVCKDRDFAGKEPMKKLIQFWKNETVLCIALFLAVVSSVLVLPDREYLGYIDFRTLAILFSLMSVMAGLQKIGLFQWIAERMLKRVRSAAQLVLILVLLCFIFSMLITNDVALITFVPFTFTVLGLLGEEQKRKLMIPIVAMQTIAANLGSMLTPVGNPQNLYLYGKAGLAVGEFLLLMLPYTLLALAMLLLWCMGFAMFFRGNGRVKNDGDKAGQERKLGQESKSGQVSKSAQPLQISFAQQTSLRGRERALVAYLILFGVCLLVVAHVVPYIVALLAVVAVVVLLDKKVLLQVDYSLLLTFVGFFVFIGNMGRIPVFSSFLQRVVEGNELWTAVISSQAISNVPAALLLSGFTSNYEALIVGTNLGGLGTLIASMASLISYKFVARECGGRKGAYLFYFTVANICFLLPLVILYRMIK